MGANMLKTKKIFFQIENNIKEVIKEDSVLGKDLYKLLLQQHPADIAMLVNRLPEKYQIALFKKLPKELAVNVFQELYKKVQALLLIKLKIDDTVSILKKIPTDKLTELFAYLPDEDLKKYLKLFQKVRRNNIISRLSFNPDSAGRIMNSDVITLQKDFTVKKSVSLLQKLGEKRKFLQRIYITDQEDKLVGYINLDDLILNKPETSLKKIIHKNELLINANDDREDIAHEMNHYKLLCAPVVDSNNHFLGVITADDIIDILKEEASEDVYKMSGLTSTENHYFQTPIWKLIWQRSPWLVGLLLLQSVSSFILSGYKNVVDKYFIISMFLTMLIGTGGNAGNQSSAIIIRGLATGEMSRRNGLKVLLREFGVSLFMASLLTVVSFFRVYFFKQDLLSAFAVSLALFFIVVTSMLLGTILPLLLERFNFDPAHSAAPFLATLMDILGVTIYCFIVNKVLG